jgi:hypothetical protein
MSGGITQLVAIGAQDAHLVGKPEVSFFQSIYKRHTNFSHVVERQIIQGNVSNNGTSTVRFERRGDLLGYVYLTASGGGQSRSINNWSEYIERVELLVGGQVIDDQSAVFSQRIAPDLFAQNYSKSPASGFYKSEDGNDDVFFYPLRFFFCENWQSALPLVALQYHDVEIRITWGPNAIYNNITTWECFSDFVYLDTQERKFFADNEHMLLTYQVQKATASGTRVQELNFNHPVKFLASYSADGLSPLIQPGTKIKLQVNGNDVADFKYAKPHFTHVPAYYHTSYSTKEDKRFIMPFCLETAKFQPTGSLNFSRLDSARIITDGGMHTDDVYAVNFNILKITNGMGGLLYAN